MIIEARRYNIRFDDVVEDILLKKTRPVEEYSFVRILSGTKNEIKSELTRVESGLKTWRDITTKNLVESFLFSLGQDDKAPVELLATNWSPYILHVLYDRKDSLLYQDDQEGRSYRIVPVDASNGRKEGKYWKQVLALYRRENPTTRGSNSMLGDRPSDYKLLLPDVISFAAFDGDKMVGYINCSLSDVHYPLSDDHLFNKEINLFNQSLKSRPNGINGCGYDVFCIDGLHIHKDYRGKGSLSKILVFYALEFITRCHKTLGVTLLSSSSCASATKAILTGFGFTHFNVEVELAWISDQFNDYYNHRTNSRRPLEQNTPDHLLTIPRLIQSLDQFMEKYPTSLAESNVRYNHIIETMTTMREWLKVSSEKGAKEPPINREKGDAWPAILKRDVFRLLLGHIEGWLIDIKSVAIIGSSYQKNVSELLGSNDHIDTFLYLGDGSPLLEERLRAFWSSYRKEAQVSEKNEDEFGTVVIGEDPYDWMILDRDDPTEDDMILYDMWMIEEEVEVVNDRGGGDHPIPITKDIDYLKQEIDLLENEYDQKERELEEIKLRLNAKRGELVRILSMKRNPVTNTRKKYAEERARFIRGVDQMIIERAAEIGGNEGFTGARARIIARDKLREEGMVMNFMSEKEWIRKNYPS
jgi:hypothetical protein